MAESNFKSRSLYHGDNLDFLRGMNSETVNLIATDPPFNKNRDFHATPDSLAAGAKFQDRWSWERDVHEEWTDSIKDDWPAVWEVVDAARTAYGDDMGAFLCWLGVRLMEMRRVLRQDGTLYLHCDPTASHYIKALLDAIFGRKQFRNEIIWHYQTGGVGRRWFGRKHDVILMYTKDDDYKFYPDRARIPRTPEVIRRIKSGVKNATRSKDLSKLPMDVWTDIQALNAMSNERTGYPTQKPIALYERIIKASSNEGDIVLDPFCGCATTPVAAERLKRQWVGMDIWDGALDVVKERMERDTILRSDDNNHVTLPKIHYETEPPIRSDENEIAAPTLRLRIQRPVMPWEKITHRGMTNILAVAQGSNGGVICAGCGRALEREFMQLDHILPKAEGSANHILNRILLCGPCNRRKRNYLTLAGLRRDNKKKAVGWMKDEGLAKMAQEDARYRAEWVRDFFDTAECQVLIAGR